MPNDRKKVPIGVELVRRGIVSEQDIQRAMEYQRGNSNKKLGDILHILDIGDQNALIQAIGEITGEKAIILRYGDINIDVTDYISLDVAKQNKAIPFDISNGKVKVCFADTANKRVMDSVRLLLLNKGLVMERYITFESNIDAILETFEGQATDNISVSRDVTTLVDNIIKTGMEKRASDIHIEPLETEVRGR